MDSGRLRVEKTLFNTHHYFENAIAERWSFRGDVLLFARIIDERMYSAIDLNIGKILNCSFTALGNHNVRDLFFY